MSLCPDIRRKRVLDFGCGAGVCFKFLCERGCEVIACDSQYHLIAARVARALRLPVLTYSSIEQLPKGPYDYIMALDVLEHVEDLAYIVQRFKEMCHSSTRIIVSGPTENLFYKFGRFLAGFSGHYHCRSIYDIERTLIDSGYALNTLDRLFWGVQLFRISSWSLAGDTR
jgi:2-polyprenyl-3-methyl-5-hydroxy-6-metoxy-1,4-benzoquinol methylase